MHAGLQRGVAELAVALHGVAVTRAEVRARHVHGQVQRGAGTQGLTLSTFQAQLRRISGIKWHDNSSALRHALRYFSEGYTAYSALWTKLCPPE